MNPPKKKIYIYYGTEENGYETQKFETKNPEKDLTDQLSDGFDKKEVKELVAELLSGFNEEGCMYVQDGNEQGYGIFIGIAKKSLAKTLADELKYLRREFMK